VADIFRAHGERYRAGHVLAPEQARAMRAIEVCRTAALGGHLDRCDSCEYEAPSYNSCRNRHCPKCQSLAQAQWVEQRMKYILPTVYFHVVFTLPGELQALALRNRKLIFDLLFAAVSATLLELAGDRLGAILGITTVLHTWTRDLRYHPHLHCIVTGGGLAQDGSRWVGVEAKRFLFPVRVLSRLFRGKFLAALRRAEARGLLDLGGPGESAAVAGFDQLVDKLYRKDWVVYAKRPFGGPEQVYRYLGRYTHRVGISNHRLLAMDERGVRFGTRNGKTATLLPEEFIRRFLLHVLPTGFVKIRHYGLMASANLAKLDKARRLLGQEPAPETEADGAAGFRDQMLAGTGVDVLRCPRCKTGTLIRHPLAERPPPRAHPP
jgi:hypothetical protein